MPVEAVHIIAACENWLLAAEIIGHPFSVAVICRGVLKEHLTMEDYRAPLEVSIIILFHSILYAALAS